MPIRFGISDVDSLRHTANILREISREILGSLNDTEDKNLHAVAAVKNTDEIANTLLNWALVLERRALDEIIQGKARLQRTYTGTPVQK